MGQNASDTCEIRLEDAVIVEGGDPDVVSVGSRVVVQDDDGDRLEVEISALGGDGTTSPSSPLGAALLSKRVGETVERAKDACEQPRRFVSDLRDSQRVDHSGQVGRARCGDVGYELLGATLRESWQRLMYWIARSIA